MGAFSGNRRMLGVQLFRYAKENKRSKVGRLGTKKYIENKHDIDLPQNLTEEERMA